MRTEADRSTDAYSPGNRDASIRLQSGAPTYYGLPPVKHSHYRWTIGTSFFAAGLGGSLELLSTALDLVDGAGERRLVRAARYAALAGSVAAPALYIKDLGTPSRWFNMLRIFRPTSLMSVGSWSLAALGMFNGLAALGQAIEDAGYAQTGRRAARAASLLALPSAMLVTPYMGSELEETSTPFWAASSPILPALFAVSNVANGLAVLELAAVSVGPSRSAVQRITGLAAVMGIAELLLLKRLESTWVGTEETRLLSRMRHGLLYRTGAITAGKLAALALRAVCLFGPRRSSKLLPVASFATLVTGFFLPAVLLFAGNRSADRPQDYFSMTRATELPGTQQETATARAAGRGRHPSRRRRFAIALAAAAVGAIVLALAGAGRRRNKEPMYDMAAA